MRSLFLVFDTILSLYTYVIIAQVILSWLIAFQVINTRNQLVYQIGEMLYRVTEPVYGKIRRVIPTVGGIDLSPLIVLLIIMFVRNIFREYGLL